MASLHCPICAQVCAAAYCPTCERHFDPNLVATPDRVDDDQHILEDVRGSLRDETYAIEGLLAVGGMGVVLRGRRRRDGLPIVIKAPRRCDRRAADRFAREARALASFDHPYLPALIDIDVSRDNRPLLVLEYLPGRSLRQLLSAGGLDPAGLERILRCCCEALDHCHRRGIIHRDVKPENIVIGEDRCLLIDFGLALVGPVTGGPVSGPRLTPEGSLLGTPPYAAPEQLRDPHRIDDRADSYALGMVLRDCLAAVAGADEAWRRGWLTVADALCDPEPERRPSLLSLIGRCQDGLQSGNRPVVVPPPPSRHLLVSVIAGALAALVLLSLVLRPAAGRRLSGSIAPGSTELIELRLDAAGSLQVTPLGDTRIRLPGGGPWVDHELALRGAAREVVQLYLRAPDGSWELTTR
jgi:predicted Ser/Thr protein kinase